MTNNLLFALEWECWVWIYFTFSRSAGLAGATRCAAPWVKPLDFCRGRGGSATWSSQQCWYSPSWEDSGQWAAGEELVRIQPFPVWWWLGPQQWRKLLHGWSPCIGSLCPETLDLLISHSRPVTPVPFFPLESTKGTARSHRDSHVLRHAGENGGFPTATHDHAVQGHIPVQQVYLGIIPLSCEWSSPMGKSSPGPRLPPLDSAVHLALEGNQVSSMTCPLTVISVVPGGRETTVSRNSTLSLCVLYVTGSRNLPGRELWCSGSQPLLPCNSW